MVETVYGFEEIILFKRGETLVSSSKHGIEFFRQYDRHNHIIAEFSVIYSIITSSSSASSACSKKFLILSPLVIIT